MGSSKSGCRPASFGSPAVEAEEDDEPGEAAEDAGPIFAALAGGASSTPVTGASRFMSLFEIRALTRAFPY